MRVWIHPKVFETERQAKLGVLCEHGLEARHCLMITDSEHQAYKAWREQQSGLILREWDKALKNSSKRHRLGASTWEIEIVEGESSDWKPYPPKLSLTDAVDLLNKKFQIVLEGDAEDEDFLRQMATENQRNELTRWEKELKGMEFYPAGGISSATKKAREESATSKENGERVSPGLRFRRWYLFDSDALEPGKESSQSQKLREICEGPDKLNPSLPFHQLKRRMIENYLPKAALDRWTRTVKGPERSKREQKFEAFLELGEPRRFFYNMKTGFPITDDGEVVVEATYDDLDSRTINLLKKPGFGGGIGKLFKISKGVISEKDLEKDGGWQEINPKVKELLAMIR